MGGRSSQTSLCNSEGLEQRRLRDRDAPAGWRPLKPTPPLVADCNDDGADWATFGLLAADISPWALLAVSTDT